MKEDIKTHGGQNKNKTCLDAYQQNLKRKNIDLMDQFVKLMVRTIQYTLETYHVPDK